MCWVCAGSVLALCSRWQGSRTGRAVAAMKLLHGARRPVMGSALVSVGYEAGMGVACD